MFSRPHLISILSLSLLMRTSVLSAQNISRAGLASLLDEEEIAGIAVAGVQNGHIQPTQAYGLRDASTKQPITQDTIFEAASLSKPVVAYCVLKLADRDLVALDAPVSRYIDVPELQEQPGWKRLTVRMLLDHGSGLPNELRGGEKVQFAFDPGARFSYSGFGFSLLQQVIEAVSHQTFEQHIQAAVFDPLGMKDSSFVWRADYAQRKARGHDNLGRPGEMREPTTPRAASSLHTTAGDYARFLQAVLTGTGLKRSTWKSMSSPQIPVQQDCVVCVSKPPAARSMHISWGLGWGIERVGEKALLFQWGENNGDFEAFVEGDIASRNGVVILTNSGNGLSIVPLIVQELLPGNHPAFAWMGYDYHGSTFRTVLRHVLAQGPATVLNASTGVASLTESQWNRIGYNLLARNRTADAIRVFEYNVHRFPDSANVYDSLAEAYMSAGRTVDAIANYKKSLALDPHNKNAEQIIQKLERNCIEKEAR